MCPVRHILHFVFIFVWHICRTYLAIFCNFCRTHLALSDIPCVFWSFLSDISSCGHIWLCRTYLAGTERSSSVVECQTRNRESLGANPPFRRLGIFRSLHRRPCSLSCINGYLAIDSAGNVSDLVLARNCCLARMLPGGVFFSGVYSWLVMTFNYLILWVRVMGQG